MQINNNIQPLELSVEDVRLIQEGALDSSPVSGLTHNYYKYPARFSPEFVKAIIEVFSEPGDLVFDPFMGGGTTLVEAMALGRRSAGSDISSLATFVSQVKTTIYSQTEIKTIEKWATDLPKAVNIHNVSELPLDFSENGYLRNLDTPSIWRIRKAIQQSLNYCAILKAKKLNCFGRCVVLKTSQWALDTRKEIPTVDEFRNYLCKASQEMLVGAEKLNKAVATNLLKTKDLKSICLHRSAVGIEKDPKVKKIQKPKLIITSPPYPGVHVLYHRWQVDGRKETPAPFWIANKLDGAGISYYAMGDRKETGLKGYFNNLFETFSSIRRICLPETILVQMVAFSDPSWQLPLYINTMLEAGFEERKFSDFEKIEDGRIWRTVPNRRWHADRLGASNSSREVVLIFTPEP